MPGGIAFRRKRHVNAQYFLRLEAWIDTQHLEKTADRQAGSCEQDHRERNLGYDKPAAHRAPAHAAGGAPSAVFQRAHQVGTRRTQSRCQAEQDTGEHRDAERKQKYPAVDRDASFVGHIVGRDERDDEPRGPHGEQHAERSSHYRQQHALREELAHEPAPASADGQAHGNFTGAPGGPGQLQIGHVDAGDEQQKPDGREQQMQAVGHLAAGRSDVHIVEQHRAQLAFRIVVRAFRGQLDVELVQLLLCGVLRDAGREPHDDRDAAGVLQIGAERQPERLVCKPAETRRHDADDGARHIVQRDGVADRVRIAREEALPEPIAEHNHGRRLAARADIEWLDCTPDKRLHFEEVESAAREVHTVEALRVDAARQQDGLDAGGHNVGKRGELLNLLHLALRIPVPAVDGVMGSQDRGRPDLIRPGIRVRRDQDAVDHAEQRDARPDAQHQRKQSHHREAGILAETPQRKANILPQPLRSRATGQRRRQRCRISGSRPAGLRAGTCPPRCSPSFRGRCAPASRPLNASCAFPTASWRNPSFRNFRA